MRRKSYRLLIHVKTTDDSHLLHVLERARRFFSNGSCVVTHASGTGREHRLDGTLLAPGDFWASVVAARLWRQLVTFTVIKDFKLLTATGREITL